MNIAVVGGGSAGLFTAWYLRMLAPDVRIDLYDRGLPGHGTTRKAAGMLAPVHELEFQEISLLRAGLASQALYRDEVAPALGEIGLRPGGSLEVGLSADDSAYLRRQFEFQRANGLPVEWLAGSQVQDIEPLVARQVHQAIYSQTDTQLDHWLLVEKLVQALAESGVRIHPNTELLDWHPSPNGGAKLIFQDSEAHVDRLVLALGVPSKAQGARLPYRIYPVRGEMIALDALGGPCPRTQVRIVSKVLGNAYVVPKADRVLIGSTSEEQGMDAWNTAGGMLNILRKAYAAVPSVYEMRVADTWAGLRPSTLNRLPVLGREAGTDIWHINGLYRHGILLGPLLGKSLALQILGKSALPETEEFALFTSIHHKP